MKLLVLTQAVDLDDPVLGFFHRWLEEFARRCESVHVICLREGRHALPPNVVVHSLGKESGRSRLRYVLNFYRYIWSLRREYDSVFVHMNPEYVLLGGIFWRMLRKRIGLWYVHRSRTLTMRFAVALSHITFTSSTSSMSVQSSKIQIVGHGIDVASFQKTVLRTIRTNTPRAVMVARISPIKRHEVAIEAIQKLRQKGIPITLDIIGEPMMRSDRRYAQQLREHVDRLGLADAIRFRGAIEHSNMPETIGRFDLAINASPTGGIDKAALESIAAGVPTFIANLGFREYLRDLADIFLFPTGTGAELAEKIEALLFRNDVPQIQHRLTALARERADVSRLIPDIMALYAKK
jgi:glycosyltransferase involved in cell wall biosynthesis